MTRQQHHKAIIPPSLLEPESRGGDTAEGGFSFQDNVTLSYLPAWLAQEGFTAMIREAMGDTEAKFFVPGRGFVIELLEVKNHTITPSEFWDEVRRFQQLDIGSPGTYGSFTLVSTGLSKELKPLVNGLRRIRDPYSFYEERSAIKDHSYKDYVTIVTRLGHTEQEARFLFEKVLIDPDWGTSQSYGEALFKQSIAEYLPEYQHLSAVTLSHIYASLVAFVRQRKNQPITRRALEATLREEIDPRQLPSPSPVVVYTAISSEEKSSALHLDWAPFFGGAGRAFPPPEQWDERLFNELRAIRDWMVNYRSVRRVKLTGSRRLSASLAIGSVFSAVAGFTLEMDYRDDLWASDAHPTPDTPDYPLVSTLVKGCGKHLVVSVGILHDMVAEVEGDLVRHGLAEMPRLHMTGDRPINSPQQANAAVQAIKHSISQALASAGSEQIDLFLAGPSYLALFLGHRLNATAPIQCYERVAPGCYRPTCRLFAAMP